MAHLTCKKTFGQLKINTRATSNYMSQGRATHIDIVNGKNTQRDNRY